MMKPSVSAAILAAGTSTRMNEMKQLAKIQGTYMLKYVIDQVSNHPFQHIFVIVGHQADIVMKMIQVEDKRVQWLVNDQYKQGQSTSFKLAMEQARQYGDSVMMFLADQPLIEKETVNIVLNEGITRVQEEPFIVRPMYEKKEGHPVYWGNIHALDCSAVNGDKGGKTLMEELERMLIPVHDQGVLVDVDTCEDYKKVNDLMKRKSPSTH
ncbi:NTP transferase domain-containing protein [Halalkalibacterium halodurans]|uniref:nucleotidyltransferase family protein n=1 Tax=Halalkalibacterium halodurans TaxID=86665 RepID=UPI002E1ED4F2|nr:NTP transferase domain-containing protein [Halalkalibacterium halodurans]